MTAVHVFVAAAAGFAVAGVLLAVGPRPRRGHHPGVTAVVAALAGVAGAFAPPDATGTAAVDAVLRVAVVAGVTALGARSSRRLLAVAAVVVAVGSVGGAAAVPAGAAAGVACAVLVSRARRRWLRAVVAGTVAVAALHLSWPETTAATAGAAAVGLGLLAVGGLVRLPRQQRRRTLAVVGAVAGLFLLAGAAGAAAAARARGDVAVGVREAQDGLAAAQRGASAEATAAFERARSSFADARRGVDAWWARPALVAPVVARHARALRTLTEAGTEVAAASARLAAASDPAAFTIVGGQVPLEALRRLHEEADDVHASVRAAARDLDRVASPWLVSPVGERLHQLAARVDRAERDIGRLALATRVGPALLGGDGARRYLLVIQTPAEQRATGGFIGSFAELVADGGALRLERLGRTAELNTGGRGARTLDAPDDYRNRYDRFDPHELWQNVNMSPDFPTVARVVAHLYPQSGGQAVDGVIAVDPHGLAAILAAVGPVRVPDWPEPIAADNATRVLLFEQYVRFQGQERVDFLASVTEAVWRRLLAESTDVIALGRALGDAVGEKHLLMAAVRADEGAALGELDVNGAVAPVDDDFLGVVTQNASGNKIDWFLRRAVAYDVDVEPTTGAVEARLRVTLRNEAPAAGLPDYVIGSALKPPLPRGTNRTYLSVYTPWLLRGATLDGAPTGLESQRELGRNVYSAFVDVPPGGSVVVELALEGSRAGDAGDRYRVAVHRQPGVVADEVSVSVGGRARRLALVRDRTLSFPLPG